MEEEETIEESIVTRRKTLTTTKKVEAEIMTFVWITAEKSHMSLSFHFEQRKFSNFNSIFLPAVRLASAAFETLSL